ncbi:MAG: hypothetical protein IT171_00905, partial [Acidobacteria bacterium]|nr:hypothetical protein [Acidobacteriota bacterium]
MKDLTKLRQNIVVLSILLFGLVGSAFADDAPGWVSQVAGSGIPTYDIKNVPAVVLLDEYVASVDSSGRISTTTRYAIKILTNEGRRLAIARGS